DGVSFDGLCLDREPWAADEKSRLKGGVRDILEVPVFLQDPDHRGIVSAFRHDLGNQPGAALIRLICKVPERRDRSAVYSGRAGLDALEVPDALRIDTCWNAGRLARITRIV